MNSDQTAMHEKKTYLEELEERLEEIRDELEKEKERQRKEEERANQLEPWRPQQRQDYFIYRHSGEAEEAEDAIMTSFMARQDLLKLRANSVLGITQTGEEMRNRMEYHRIIRELEELADGGPYVIDYFEGGFRVVPFEIIKDFNPSFSAQERAEKAINIVGEDRLRWAFKYARNGGKV